MKALKMITAISILVLVNTTAYAQKNTSLTIYSIYSGQKPLSSYINNNKVGQDNNGLHWWADAATGRYNLPGIDVYNDGKIYSPLDICPANGDSAKALDDLVGTGGHTLELRKNVSDNQIAQTVRILMFHLGEYAPTLKEKIIRGECIYAHELLAYEGNSTTAVGSNGVKYITTFDKVSELAGTPAHTHLSIGKNTQWNNECFEIEIDGWWWVNASCVSTPWEQIDDKSLNPWQNGQQGVLEYMFKLLSFDSQDSENLETEMPFAQVDTKAVLFLTLIAILAISVFVASTNSNSTRK